MRTIAITWKKNTGQAKEMMIKIQGKRTFLTRFCYYVESADWDKKFVAAEKWLNRVCALIIILSVIYFIPVIISK